MAISNKGAIGAEVLELSNSASAAVSSASTVRVRANIGTGKLEVSEFGGAYAAIGGSVELPPDEITYSFVNNLHGSGSTSMGSSASFTQAVSIAPLRELTMTGLRFWCNFPSPTDMKASLWESTGGSRVADGTATIAAADGFYVVSFSTPYTITSSDVGSEFRLSLYHVSGTSYPRATTAGGFMPTIPFVANTYIQSSYNLFGSGDAYPTSVAGSDLYIIEPVFDKVSA
jgi:hypothetical protein